MSPQEAQALYDSSPSVEAAGKSLGLSRAEAFGLFKRLHVRLRGRGGANRGKMRPARRDPCPHGVTLMGLPLPCACADLGECETCLRSHRIESYVSPAATCASEASIGGVTR